LQSGRGAAQGIGGALIFNPILLQLTVNPQARPLLP